MRIQRGPSPPWLRRLIGVLIVWTIVAILVIIESVPETPTTIRGWVLLLLLGPPVYVAVEWAVEKLISAKMGSRISPARFSFRRIGILLFVMVVIPAAVVVWSLTRAR